MENEATQALEAAMESRREAYDELDSKQIDNRTGDVGLDRLIEEAFFNAQYNGWTEEIPFAEMCALLHSEISEALEEHRYNTPLLYHRTDSNGLVKPEGKAAEFADLFIRLMHYSKLLDIDLVAVTLEKLKYNRTRGYRHGGKRI